MRRRYVCIDADCPAGERFMLRLRDGGVAIPFEGASFEAVEAKADAFEADGQRRAAKRGAPPKRAARAVPA